MSTSTVGLEPGFYRLETGGARHWNGTAWSAGIVSVHAPPQVFRALEQGPRMAIQVPVEWVERARLPGWPVQASADVEADPAGRDPHASGAKLDAGKVRPWLCIAGFPRALSAVADVTTKGAIKYTPNGWQEVPDGESRYMEAFGRHMLALARGEQIDADTGCLHKAQMAWNLLASLELELRAAGNWNPTP